MHPQFNRLTPSTQSSFIDAVAALKLCVIAESEQVFSAIIRDYGHLHIYNLGLYFSAGSWSYLLPTFSSEEGLATVAAGYAKHSPIAIEQQKKALRWSPCDSPHHCDDELEAMMPGTERMLEALEELISNQDPDLMDNDSEEQAEAGADYESYYELINEVHEMIHSEVVDALKSLALQPSIKAFLASKSGVITLSAGDQSDEEFLHDLRQINGDQAFVKVQQDYKEAEEIRATEYQLQKKKLEHERLHPPTTQLTLGDFRAIIEQFSPEFFQQDGGIFVARKYEYNLYGESEREVTANRFELMQLLEKSPHYPELDKLYGHFIGVNFQPDDLLPSICRALVVRLGEALKQKFPDRQFGIYMVVDRNVLYHFSFHLKRNDGYTFDLMPDFMLEQGGVEEVHWF